MVMTFLVNEYNDYETDLLNQKYHRLSGGSRVLPMGLLSQQDSLIAAYVCMAGAGITGLVLYFIYDTGPLTIPLGMLAMFIGYFYTARPLRFAYHGLGEIAIWVSCGWLANSTGYYLQTGHFSDIVNLISLPGATSVFLVILVNEIPDIESDRISGKRNLAVRLGKEGTLKLFAIALVLCYINMLAIIPFDVPVWSAILSVTLLPFIVLSLKTARRGDMDNPQVQETLSMKTMVIDHLITLIYAVAFVIVGLDSLALSWVQVGLISLLFVMVFSLEGIGVLSSKLIAQK
jgi:1,4-dihydroxy-2-naphthoate octaprenyltransferase